MRATGSANLSVVLFTNSSIMGGMEEHVLQVGRGLAERGIRVGVICSTRPAIKPLREALAQAGITVHALPERSRSAAGLQQRFRDLVSTFRAYPGCVLHLHSTGYRGADLVVLAARLGGARAAVRTMHLPPVPPIPMVDRLLTPIRDRLLARIICVAEANRLEHVQLLGRDPRRCIVVHNGIDLREFSPDNVTRFASVSEELGLPADTPIVGTISRLGEHRKGMAYFIEMAAGMAADLPAVRFVVVGEGELRPELERQVARHGIADRVIFTGERHDVPRLLAAMRVFVNPSLWEAGPYTVLEAAAMRIPIVSTPVGFVPEVILKDGREGLLVPLADAAALERAVRAMLADPTRARQMADFAHARVVEEFSVGQMVDRLVKIYAEVADS